MPDWIADAKAALADGPAALVTILATEGSAPRGAGTRMVVTAATLRGTIGGGALEWRATEQARAILALPQGTWRIQDYPLGPLLGQCCGGRVRLLVERLADSDWMGSANLVTLTTDRVSRERFPGEGGGPGLILGPGLRRGTETIAARGPLPTAGTTFVEPDDIPRRPLMLFGAGHVGQAIAHIVPGLPFDLAWFDSRAEADRAGVVVQDEAALLACAGEAAADTAVLIMTHDHALDYRLAAAALATPAGFVGLIGSRTKRARFVARLAADGVDPARLVCPIGAAGIVGKQPAVIAVAALAQLLAS